MNNIKIIRLNKNLTLKELSEISGVAYGYISDLENGKAVNPTYATLKKIAKALEVPISELIEEKTA
ncbi:helix-turn-helix domain-containing protein [Paramaledivibacter caminithermalis]|uniref:Helix-turn-helix n=1 Tax=Paramaledivibacter caminithermalis (strain DSM 15212 / CIP 107654 / DViRD3) TaxID=1121301 RepID=A0A1M6TW00_PARC5|nr:helix-turn-helix transcriptional regulator [Paramaledivibacter caminithermalis]SHK61121.1 Helix-turn-helix [Paramaledivibacter caminithermalis DSM 15212]